MHTLVAGATGLLGPEICRHLVATGHSVRGLVRPTSSPDTRASLEQSGIELIEGDLKDPGSLARACAGVAAVVSTATSTHGRQSGDTIETVDHHGQLALVNAAREAGVGHVVFVSFRRNPAFEFPLGVAKGAVERALATSGMAYTVLQASLFMEVWLSPRLGFDPANGKVRIYGSGESPISWVAYRDVARAAAMAVSNRAARNMVVEFGGPDALSPREVVRIFEAAGAGSITIETVPEAALRAQLETAPDSLQKTFAGLMLQYAAGDAIDPAMATRLFPFERTSVRDYAAVQLSQA
jgi:NADH dehydrogenase